MSDLSTRIRVTKEKENKEMVKVIITKRGNKEPFVSPSVQSFIVESIEEGYKLMALPEFAEWEFGCSLGIVSSK